MPTEQPVHAAKQGGAYDVITHFTLGPIFLANLIVAIIVAVHATEHSRLHWWLVVVSAGLLLLNVKVRLYSLALRDRMIRLEERLRITALVPGEDVSKLSMKQLIGLRFASDAELPALVRRTLVEGLDQKAIKAAVETWRSDDVRI
jgi:hypothetical protein